jgi:drug/metabolite transporter (DMT)-like permease
MGKINKSNYSLYLFTGLAALFWSSAFVGIRIGVQGGYSPYALALLRYFTASLVMIPLYIKYRKTHAKLTKNEIFRIIISGVIGLAAYNITLNYGEITVPSAIASFIISQCPIFMVLLAIIFLNERISLFGWVGIGVSTLGLILIALGQWQETVFTWDIIIIVIAALMGAIYSIIQKPLLTKLHGVEITALAIWSATIAMLVFTPNLIREIPHASKAATLAAIYMGIFPGAIAYALWGMILSRVPASQAAGYLYINPLIATLLGWLLLGEIPLLLSFIGGMIALVGAIILHYNRD